MSREVFAEIISPKAYDCFMLACDMVKMLYGKYRIIHGWEDGDIDKLESIIWAHNIKAEELYGATYCSENVEYSVHMPEVIKRHSSPDNYSCEMFERIIRSHKLQSTNSKTVEVTYAERENIRQFVNNYEKQNGPVSNFDGNVVGYRFQVADYVNPQDPVLLKEKSVANAKQLLKDLKTNVAHHGIEHATQTGVIVGSLKRKSVCPNHRDELQRLVHRLNPQVQGHLYFNRANFARKIVKWDCNEHLEVFSVGEQCILESPDGDEEWVVTITAFILMGPIAGRYHLALDCDFYVPGWNGRDVAVHPWTKTIQFVKRHYPRNRMQLSPQIKRKIILYPEPSNLENPSFYLAIDFDSKDVSKPAVPFYPGNDDFIKIQGTHQEIWYGKVIAADHVTRKAQIQWFDERQPGQLVLLQPEATIAYASIIGEVTLQRRLWYYEVR